MFPGIYVHLPFCRVRCSYCDFPLTTRLALQQPYYSALIQELQSYTPPAADTLYFGGGTPSVTSIETLQIIRTQVNLLPESEITLEANPDDIIETALDEWLDLKINRLSIGVQSFQPEVLKSMLRLHSPEESVKAINQAKQAGFSNINIDLILGYPGQSMSSFLTDLKKVIELGPQHLSLYLLETHERTLLQKRVESGKEHAMSEDDQVNAYVEAVSSLKSAGYHHYEVSNFALPGFESRHNLKYWTHAPYYGYGAGACSYYDSTRIQNLKSVQEYIRRIELGEQPIEIYTQEDAETAARNALIFGLRQVDGVDSATFAREFGSDPLNLFPDRGSELFEAALLELKDGRLRLTLQGLLLSNEILSQII